MTQQATESQPQQLIKVSDAIKQLSIGRTKFYGLVREGVFTLYNLNADAPRGPILAGQKRPAIRLDQAEVDAYKERIKVPAA